MEQNKENSTKSQDLCSYSEKDQKWDFFRSKTQDIETIYEKNGIKKLPDRMHDCSEMLGFAWEDNTETGESRLRLRTASFCRVRHCPICMWRRSMKNIALFKNFIETLKDQQQYQYLFLTLTVPNCRYEDLRQTIKGMNESWRRLTKRKDFPAVGFIKSTEVTNEQKRKGYAHPHFHILLAVKPSYFGKRYIPKQRWLELWQEATGDYSITQVDIRKVKPNGRGSTSLESAVVETLKYGTKVEDILDEDFLIALTHQLHKLRFLSTGGVLKDAIKEEVSNQEMIETGDDEAEGESHDPSLYFGWQRQRRKYQRVSL